jgi:hypothetical protein
MVTPAINPAAEDDPDEDEADGHAVDDVDDGSGITSPDTTW